MELDAWAGGSSSGSGSAVAAGLVPFAIGSETWGSILSPAATVASRGLRPTYGRVSRHGAMALCWTLDKLGPLALSPRTLRPVLAALAGRDPPTRPPWIARYARTGGAAAASACSHATAAARTRCGRTSRIAQRAARVGTVEEVALPELPYDDAARTILFAEAAARSTT